MAACWLHVQAERGFAHRRPRGHDDQVRASGSPPSGDRGPRNPLGTPVTRRRRSWSCSMRSIVGQISSLIRMNSSARRSCATWKMRCSALSSTSLGVARPSYASCTISGGRLDQAPQQRLVAHDRPWYSMLARWARRRSGSRRSPCRPPGRARRGADSSSRSVTGSITSPRSVSAAMARNSMPVAFPVKHRVVEQLRGLQGRVLIEQHGAEHRLLGLGAPRGLAAGVLAVSRRGDGGRYGRHPRSVSSNWGYEARRPDGR